MEHSYPLVETIVGGLVFAFILGMVAQRLRMPPLIGYLFAGIIVCRYHCWPLWPRHSRHARQLGTLTSIG